MAEAVDTSSWDTSVNKIDEFLHFAFGSFNSKNFTEGEFIRTYGGDRFNDDFAPQMNDKVVDVPGGDGQLYFGTFHKAKVIPINFAFKGITKEEISTLKKALSGKEMKELCLSENPDRVYIAKVTGQPNLKYIPFDVVKIDTISSGEEGGEPTTKESLTTVYNGEGSVQFTAYWPYARSKSLSISNAVDGSLNAGFSITNNGELPTHFIFTSDGVASVMINGNTISGSGITEWNSKTGIVKNGSDVIEYTGNGIMTLPVDTVSGTTEKGKNGKISFYEQYY